MKKVFLLTLASLLITLATLQGEDHHFFVKNSFTSPIVSIDSGTHPHYVFISGSDGRLMIINNEKSPQTIYDSYIHSGQTLDVSLSKNNRKSPLIILAYEADGYKIFVLQGDKRKTIPIPFEKGIPQSIQYTEDGESFYIYGPNYKGITFYNAQTLKSEPYLTNLKNYSFDYVHTGKEPHSEKLFGYSKNTLHLSVENYKLLRSVDAKNSPENIRFRAVAPGFIALLPVAGNQILALKKESLYLLQESDYSIIREIPIKLEGTPKTLKGNSLGDQFIVIFEKEEYKYFVKGTILKDRILFEEGRKFQFKSEINSTYWGPDALWLGSQDGELLYLTHQQNKEKITHYPYKKLLAIEDIEFKDKKTLSLFTADKKTIPLQLELLTQNQSSSPEITESVKRDSPLFLFGGKGALLNLSQNRLEILTRKGNDFIFQKEREINPLVEKAVFLEEYLYTLHHTQKGAIVTQISLKTGNRKALLTSVPFVYGFFAIETPSYPKEKVTDGANNPTGQILISGRTSEGENRLYFIDKNNKETPVLNQGGVLKNNNLPLLIDTTTTEKKGTLFAAGRDGDIYSLIFNSKKELRCTKVISLTKFGQIPQKITSGGEILATLNKDNSISLFHIKEKRPIAKIYIFSEEKWIAIVYKNRNGKLLPSLIASNWMNEADLDKIIRIQKTDQLNINQ